MRMFDTLQKYILLAAVFSFIFLVAGKAEAGTLQIGCFATKTAYMDPILRPADPMMHVFFGNKNVKAKSTYSQLVRSKATTCNKGYDTSSYWLPAVWSPGGVNKPKKMTVYYSQGARPVERIPSGLKMIGKRYDFRCGFGKPTRTPPYGCDEKLRIRIHFPNCWNGNSTHHRSLRYRTSFTECPPSHPRMLPITRISVHYGVVKLRKPLLVNMGYRKWENYTSLHGDIFNAGQQPGFTRAIDRCVRSNRGTRAECRP